MNHETNSQIEKRIFLVGSARSGTTLLQSILSSHPDIYSFPETHFFSKTLPMRRSKRFIWRFKKKDLLTFEQYFHLINKEHLLSQLNLCISTHTISIKKWINGIIKLLDLISLDSKKTIWLEKTPAHIRYVNLIEKTRKDIYFIHMIRKGEDVIASLYQATNQYPELWNGARSIENCIKRWKRDIAISSQFIGKKRHFFVIYDELVKNPEKVIKNLCSKLNISYYSEMLDNYSKQFNMITLKNEKWKVNVKKKIEKKSKFDQVFNDEEKRLILSSIKDIDLSVFR